MTRTKQERGSTLLEFTMVGIPLIFLLISTVEMARGMWLYVTLANAIRQGTRFAIVKGQNCSTSPNACSVTIARIAEEVRKAGVGLDPSAFTNVTFKAHSGTTVTHNTLQECLSDTTQWPAASASDPGASVGADIEISAVYPFRTAMSMFWPGAGRGVTFGAYNFPASSRESIQF